MTKTQLLKIFLIVLGIVMISATGYAGWKINKEIEKATSVTNWPTIAPQATKENEKAEWRLYVNRRWQFRIKYPANFEFYEYQETGLRIPIRDGEKYLADEFTVLSIVKEQGMGLDEFYIKVYDCKDSQAVNSLMSDILEGKSEGPEIQTWIQTCSINNLPCRKKSREGIWGLLNTKQREVSYHIIRDTLIYDILFSANFPDTATTFETIASSFQFVD